MNKRARFNFPMAAFLLITVLGAGTAAAQNNTALGDGALANPLASNLDDSAVGLYALHVPTSGVNNTAVGAYALFQNTTGHHNAAIGVGALYTNNTGSYNTASGASALEGNTTGSDNTAS